MQPITIVIPAFNEEEAIGDVLTQLAGVLTQAQMVYEIIVVDDGSEDTTAAVIADHDVILLQHRTNKGYGAALKTGIQHASHDVVCITDADGTYPNDRIPELAGYLYSGPHDMVVGARTGDDVSIPLLRRPAKWALRKLAYLVAGEPIPDLNSGLRVFRRSVALKFFNILPNQFSFTTTITLAMLTNQYLVEYIPINYYERVGQSKIRPIQDTLNFVQLVLRIALYFAPLKIFVPLSALLLALGVGWAVFSLFVLGQLADVSTIVIVMTAFQVAVIGMLAELINRRLPNYYRD